MQPGEAAAQGDRGLTGGDECSDCVQLPCILCHSTMQINPGPAALALAATDHSLGDTMKYTKW